MSNNKDWVGTQNSLFKMLGASNHCDEEREENDFYATDPIAIDHLLSVENFSEFIWEPCCGQGHLSERLKSFGYKVFNTDIIDRGYQDFNEVLDFLTCDGWKGHLFQGDIITNPPYKYCSEFIKKSLDVVGNGRKVAMFLKLQTLEGQKRYQEIFSAYPPKSVYVFVKRVACGKNGKFDSGSSAVCYAWFVWEKGWKGDTTLKWINNI